ncbi:MAG: zinc-dependent peptidase [Gammaproteobacteria bacterium]|nr:zinc-dependent peptidase [Gammaproteobacteria bacterium]
MSRTQFWRTWRRRPQTIDQSLWSHALAHCRYAQTLTTSDRKRLRDTVVAFLSAKHIDGTAGFEMTTQTRAIVALKACVPILNLGMNYYRGWSDIIIYPADFRVREEYMDDAGVVHQQARDLCGQALTQGPIVLSWQAIEDERDTIDRDVVIHECAHKLDILNGAADGFPPLPSSMAARQWTDVFSTGFDHFCRAVEIDDNTPLDPYAAVDPAEFFAVLSETFFTAPSIVYHDFPAVYCQLSEFYRQDPYALLGDGE